MSLKLSIGDRVHARWGGNGCYYQGKVKKLDLVNRTATLDWDDGDQTDCIVEWRDVCPLDDDNLPSSRANIEMASFVRELPGKGRCLFSRKPVSSGDVIFIERATLVAIPSKNQSLWDKLKHLHEADAFVLGTITFHFAALLSLFTLNDADLQVILDKFVPDGENDEVSEDIHKILKAVQEDPERKDYMPLKFPNHLTQLTPQVVQHLTNAWRYNSFGHHTEDGLVLYNRISMAAHGCDPTCCWTYGDEDSFVLRARVAMQGGQELTISYLQDDDLLKSTDVRRKKLENWKFTCGCTRCMIRIDTCRGYRCLKCRAGAHFYVENQLKPGLTHCDVCGEHCKDAEMEQCLQLEPEYIARIEKLDKTNIHDVEIVYNATLDFFHESHWCVFSVDNILWEYYREKDISLAILHQEKKIQYHARAYPRPTFVWAWALEELADNIQKFNNGLEDKRASRLAECINLYRKAQCQLAILCGPSHPYAIAPQNKWHATQQKFTALVN